ncbi:hypothetical protein F4779DRAFT_579491 [Xylariaceae sp. FL0662B]|nr:hypothetical protein F4779DRAFT_579491 [Xylariaceae sp. FL0662B]
MSSTSVSKSTALGSEASLAQDAEDHVEIANEGSGSDSEDDPPPPEPNVPVQTAKKKRVLDWVQFSQFKRDQQQNIYNSTSSSAIRDEDRSTAWLVRKAEEEKIISSPREYQTELFERAKTKNVIAVLDTGTGKTLIAALLLRHTIEKELEDRSAGKSPRVSFFLVDKVVLALQQYEVLKANLDHPIERFYGDLAESTLTYDFWQQKTKDNMVIVCTAAILLASLHHSFVRMDQINLLVFDEAHHTKKNHPYARIIKDFYASLEEGGQRRPRILGMTASPVDAKIDVTDAATKLEGLLHSEIATVADPTVFTRSSINRPLEDLIEYSMAPDPYETPLWQKLHRLVGHNDVLRRLFVYSRECTAELGRWCADRVWQICLTHEEAQKMEAKTERNFISRKVQMPIAALDAERLLVREAYHLVADHELSAPDHNLCHLSGKVYSLVGALRTHLDPEKDKCIIFVEQRLTAMLLNDLLKQPSMNMAAVRSGMLLGATGSDSGDAGMTLKEQFVTMHRFRHGDLNCIFATSVAEEGLDIPDCNLVIRFDLCKTMIQYVQSRGRARRKDSKFFHMVEMTNHGQIQSVFDNEDSEARLRQFYGTLSEDRLLTRNDYNIDYFLSQEKSHRTYIVPSTGAKLTYKMSLVILANFVSTLPHPLDTTLTADYVLRHIGREFECEVLLPDTSPIRSAIGRRATSKQVAKCSAAFEMCLQLKRKKYLDDYLQSTFAKKLPTMRNAHLAISSKKRAEYPMRTKPYIWDSRGMPEELFITILKLSCPEALDRPSRPIALLTRQPLPQVAEFPLFFGNQRTSDVECVPLSSAIETTPAEIEVLNHFTLKIFKDVFSKEYKPDPEKMPYFLAPVIQAHDFDFENVNSNARLAVDWGCLSRLQNTAEYLELENQSDGLLEEKFVIDPHDGSRKFYTIRRRHDLKPTDPELPGLPKGQQGRKARREAPADIWNFSVSLWSNARAKITVRDDLPVMEAEYIPIRRNLLDEFDKPKDIARRCYLIFETLKISALPVDVVAMIYNLPAIMYRLESNLIVLDTCKSLGLGVRPDLALEAMTKDSDNTEEHSETQVNLQRGMGKNYERLEFLGDSFLKMSTTIALFSQIPDSNEFQYHVDRMVLICNKNLFNNALDLKIEESIRSRGFNRRHWYPNGLELLRGKQNTSILGKKDAGRGVHVLADKSIADVCEALIGASYMTTYEQKNFDLAIQAVTKFVNHAHHKMTTYADYYAAYQVPEWQSADSTAVQLELARQIEEKLGYKFTHPRLLRSAFMHPSYSTLYERIPNYQRLEFLGDALLDMVCVDFLYHRFPGADPQWLTEHKMAMVSNMFLGCLCVNLGLQKHMLSMSTGLQKEIAEYVIAITEARKTAEDEAESANLDRASYARNFWVNVQRPPKCLPDIVESYVGAVFVDSKYDYNQVQRFFDVQVRPYFEDMHLYDTFANKHPVTYLSNMLQLHFRCADWRLMVEEIDVEGGAISESQVLCCLMIHGQVAQYANAASGRYAKIAAAKKMMGDLEGISIEGYKQKYGCTCTPEQVEAVDPMTHATAV